MITIDKLEMDLPAGFEMRADSILRFACDALSGHHLPNTISRIDEVKLAPITLTTEQSDISIGKAIACALVAELTFYGSEIWGA